MTKNEQIARMMFADFMDLPSERENECPECGACECECVELLDER